MYGKYSSELADETYSPVFQPMIFFTRYFSNGRIISIWYLLTIECHWHKREVESRSHKSLRLATVSHSEVMHSPCFFWEGGLDIRKLILDPFGPNHVDRHIDIIDWSL